ncbi:MAG TPA: HIT family protein [Saprospiraceae bacterium]|nr:HIT family protein [Saprospiraceae bacterium]
MSNCIFCEIVRGQAPSWKVYENEWVYAFLDINPVSRYHTLVIPKRHYVNIFDVPDEELREVISVVGKLAKYYKAELKLEGLQVINNNGRPGQQDVFHIHYHLIPRSIGDGQNIRWKTFSRWRADFDQMLKQIDIVD